MTYISPALREDQRTARRVAAYRDRRDTSPPEPELTEILAHEENLRDAAADRYLDDLEAVDARRLGWG